MEGMYERIGHYFSTAHQTGRKGVAAERLVGLHHEEGVYEIGNGKAGVGFKRNPL